MLQIVASPTDNSRGVIYNRNLFILKATVVVFKKNIDQILKPIHWTTKVPSLFDKKASTFVKTKLERISAPILQSD